MDLEPARSATFCVTPAVFLPRNLSPHLSQFSSRRRNFRADLSDCNCSAGWLVRIRSIPGKGDGLWVFWVYWTIFFSFYRQDSFRLFLTPVHAVMWDAMTRCSSDDSVRMRRGEEEKKKHRRPGTQYLPGHGGAFGAELTTLDVFDC